MLNTVYYKPRVWKCLKEELPVLHVAADSILLSHIAGNVLLC